MMPLTLQRYLKSTFYCGITKKSFFIQKNDTSEPIAVLTPLAHLGIALDSTDQVDQVAARGENEGCLAWEPRQESDPVGYICALSDPDGNLVEFSYGQEI